MLVLVSLFPLLVVAAADWTGLDGYVCALADAGTEAALELCPRDSPQFHAYAGASPLVEEEVLGGLSFRTWSLCQSMIAGWPRCGEVICNYRDPEVRYGGPDGKSLLSDVSRFVAATPNGDPRNPICDPRDMKEMLIELQGGFDPFHFPERDWSWEQKAEAMRQRHTAATTTTPRPTLPAATLVPRPSPSRVPATTPRPTLPAATTTTAAPTRT